MDGYSHSTFNNQDSRQVRNRHGIPPRWKRYLPNPGPCSRILFDNRLTTPDPSLRSATRQTIVVTKQTTGLTAAPTLLENRPPNLPICLLVGQLQSSHRAEMRRVQPCLLWGRRGLSYTHYDRPTVLQNKIDRSQGRTDFMTRLQHRSVRRQSLVRYNLEHHHHHHHLNLESCRCYGRYSKKKERE